METPLSARPWFGPFLMCLACLLFAVLDTGTKYLAELYPVNQIVWARYVAQALTVLLIFARPRGVRLLHVHSPLVQLLRGLFLCAGSVLVIHGLARLPLAEATAVVFIAPLVVTLLSGLLLHEKARRMEWVAVACGFLGVVIIARPGGGLLVWAILFPMGAAVCNALYQIVTRSIRGSEDPATTNFYTGLVGAVVLIPWGPFSWSPMAWFDLLILTGLGVVAGVGHLTLTYALANASAARLAPYGYLQIFWATLLGWFAFTAIPDMLSWVGILTIASGGLLLSLGQLRRIATRHKLPRAG